MSVPLHIAASADDRYVPYLAASLLSVLVHSDPERCVFHIVANGLSDANRSKLERMLRRKGSAVRWYDIDAEAYAEGSLFGHVSQAAYYRVSLPEMVGDDVDRLLYLDSDVIVLKDVSPLFTLPLRGRVVAAVQDANVPNGAYLGLDEREGYFNSGVLLIDVRRWREERISERVRERVREGLPSRWADQCHLNCVLVGAWERLPARWNMQAHLLPQVNARGERPTDEAYEALTDPAIVHYSSPEKPWMLVSRHPYRHLFWRSKRQTPWRWTDAPDRSLQTTVGYLRRLFSDPPRFPLRLDR